MQTCSYFGLAPLIDKTAWFQAQNTESKCSALAAALGISGVDFTSWSYACASDVIHAAGSKPGVLKGPLLCSSEASCPAAHVNNVDVDKKTCSNNICPCQQVAYARFRTGTCASHGYAYIDKSAECQTADVKISAF